nr:MAG TPA: hypothetical protein [Caudoviricetes sp.]
MQVLILAPWQKSAEQEVRNSKFILKLRKAISKRIFV